MDLERWQSEWTRTKSTVNSSLQMTIICALVRVGGGYLSIDEFVDQYTPMELEKMERRDPLKKFSEKVAVQKSISGKEVLRDASP